jgi:hypothetical protein
MNPLSDRLNDALERRGIAQPSQGQEPRRPPTSDPEVDALVNVASRLQSAPALQVDPAFAHRLEKRVLARSAALGRSRPAPSRSFWHVPRFIRAHPALGVALSLFLVIILLGTGVVVVAAQVSNPDNPLYAIKRWIEQVPVSLSGSQTDQARLDLQYARDRLNSLADLADPAHDGEYQHALNDLDQKLTTAAQAINALPAGSDHDQLASDLAALKADARQTLQGLLLRLALPERLATTEELGRLGATVPHLTGVTVMLPTRPNGQATVSISGDDLQPGAELLVDGRVVNATGTLRQGIYVFLLNWNGKQHPHTVGIMNPDGTAAETTAIMLSSPPGGGSSSGNGSGNGGGNGGSSGHGNGENGEG